MSELPKSFLPWHGIDYYQRFGRRFTSPAAKVKTVLDEWRVAEVAYGEAKLLYEQTESTNEAAMKALEEEIASRRRDVEEIVARMKGMDSFTVHNDKQLWLVFRFFFMHSHRAHVVMAPELEIDDQAALQFLCAAFFGVRLPVHPEISFVTDFVCLVEVRRINWVYYDNEDNN